MKKDLATRKDTLRNYLNKPREECEIFLYTV